MVAGSGLNCKKKGLKLKEITEMKCWKRAAAMVSRNHCTELIRTLAATEPYKLAEMSLSSHRAVRHHEKINSGCQPGRQ